MALEQAPDAGAPINDTTPVEGGAPQAPQHIELKDDSMVLLPGHTKPVKYGDFYKGFQGEYTKATQARSELEKQLNEARRELQAARQPQVQQPSTRQKLLEGVRGAQYLSGQEAASVLEAILQEQEGHFSVRDQALSLIGQKLLAIDKALSGVLENTATSTVESTLQNALKSNQLGEEWMDFAKSVYLSYEPSAELNKQFAQILKDEVDKTISAVRAADKRRIAATKPSPFPGRGGAATPSGKLSQDFSKKSPRDQAGEIWDLYSQPDEG